MDAARWDRIQALFHEAIERDEAERRAWVESACAGDAELADQVLALLAADASPGSLLDSPLDAVAGVVLERVEPPARIGAYEIRGLVGEGGMGAVYEAVRDDIGARVAIKMLADASLSPARRARFAAEQRLLARLNHPSIARLYDASTLPDGAPYFVMEFVDGVPLTEHCAARNAALTERLRLFREVCDAVAYAHRHAVVHRDLKPSNILVTADGTVKLLDFGIAKQLDALEDTDQRTRTAVRMMTPAYASPEQVLGEPAGVHSDVFALGVILYELLTGVTPHAAAHHAPLELARRIVEVDAERPSRVAQRAGTAPAIDASRSAWADLDVLCLTALHRDTQRRYHSAHALAEDIDRFLQGIPLRARPDSLRYRADRFVRRNRAAVAAAAIALLLLVGVVTGYTVQLHTARNVALAEAASAERIRNFVLSLFTGGDDEAGAADDLRVTDLLDRGVAEAALLDAEPRVQAELLATLGGIFHQLGVLDRADSLLVAAYDLRRDVAADDPDLAASLAALAALRADRADGDDLEDAERFARAALDLTLRHRPRQHPAALRAARTLGYVLVQRGSYDDAIAVLGEAARVMQQHDTPDGERIPVLRELANGHFYAGALDMADSLNAELLTLTRRVHGERHPAVSGALINRGAVRFELGRYAEAEALYREGHDIVHAFYGPDHPRSAAALNMLGRALLFLERRDEAIDALTTALAVRERVYGAAHPRVASTLNELGTVALAHDDFPAAESYYNRVADIYRETYGESHYLLGIALSNLGSVYGNSGDHARAVAVMREAVDHFTKTLSPEHMNTAIAQAKLGRALLRLGSHDEAELALLTAHAGLTAHATPNLPWLRAVYSDLVVLAEERDDVEAASRWRAALEAAQPPAT